METGSKPFSIPHNEDASKPISLKEISHTGFIPVEKEIGVSKNRMICYFLLIAKKMPYILS